MNEARTLSFLTIPIMLSMTMAACSSGGDSNVGSTGGHVASSGGAAGASNSGGAGGGSSGGTSGGASSAGEMIDDGAVDEIEKLRLPLSGPPL